MTTTDWRLAIPESRRRILRGWFLTVSIFTLCVLIVGGATRLTHSGLSMVEWQPILGIIPPVTHDDWQHRFEQYQQFPEYQKLRQGMTLHEFKFIYFWEYLHRLLARSIGLVFLLPFAFFLAKRWMNRELAWRSAALFGLGALQGLVGWLMVASGLVDRPSVSHYRLATHLSLAFAIFGYSLWLARDLAVKPELPKPSVEKVRRIMRGLGIVGALLCTQVVWGAFVAGLKAGFFANTFPLMGGRLVPTTLFTMQPRLLNLVANPTTVQWLHRVIGTVLALAVITLVAQARNADARSRRFALALLGAVLLQYVLGVLTLIHAVPVTLGVTHQAMAMILFGVWLSWLHHTRELARG